MPLLSSRRLRCVAMLALATLLLTSSTGCLLDLIHVVRHDYKIKPEYDGLVGKRVMVMCVSEGRSLGPSNTATMLSMALNRGLASNVEGIQVVSQREIDEWVDTHDCSSLDYEEIAGGVNADMVVLVQVSSFSLHEGQTMYKGRTNLNISVFDMNKDGAEVFQRTPEQIEYPEMTGQPVSDFQVNEASFQRDFINVVAGEIGRYFYPWDYRDDYASDAASLSM